MKPDKIMICLDRSTLESITNDLRELTNEASTLRLHHCLIVAASSDTDSLPHGAKVENCLFLLDLFLKEWDRERVEQFAERLDQAHEKFREILR
jgi:hypothetical protein